MRQNAPSATKARLSATLACCRGRALGLGPWGLALVGQAGLRSMGAVDTQETLAMQPKYRRENFVTLNAAESGPRLSVCGAGQGECDARCFRFLSPLWRPGPRPLLTASASPG